MTAPRTERIGRFADVERGQSIVEGYQDVVQQDPIDKAFIQRNLKRYQKFGVPTALAKLRGLSDTELEKMAARAVLKRRKVKVTPLRVTVDKRRYRTRQLQRARSVIAQGTTPGKGLAPVVRHIRRVRRARRVSAVNPFSGRGYDIWKGYT